jgi:hypothetical protein
MRTIEKISHSILSIVFLSNESIRAL